MKDKPTMVIYFPSSSILMIEGNAGTIYWYLGIKYLIQLISILLSMVPTHSHLGYYRALEQASFCSPEVLANVSERRTFPLYNHFVSDTFSIGLVCLYTMTLISPLTAYKLKTKEIDYYYI